MAEEREQKFREIGTALKAPEEFVQKYLGSEMSVDEFRLHAFICSGAGGISCHWDKNGKHLGCYGIPVWK